MRLRKAEVRRVPTMLKVGQGGRGVVGLAGSNGEGPGGKDRYARTFDVLELLVGHPAGMTVTEISKRLDLPISSSHNLLQRMVAADVVNVTDDLRYSLGPR